MVKRANDVDGGCRRDVVRLLKKLGRSNGLAREVRNAAHPDVAIEVVTSGDDRKGSQQTIARFGHEAFALARRRGWISRNGAVWRIAPDGVRWLRRQLSTGDVHRAQHQERTVQAVGIDGEQVLVNASESPLGWLRRRKDRAGRPLISDEQFRAGERLRADYTFGQLAPRVTANWSADAPSHGRSRRSAPGGADLRDEVLAAQERVRAAMRAVGPEFVGVLLDVCCELKGLEEVERDRGWARRSGKVVLNLALNALARHYGYMQASPGEDRSSSKSSHWGDEEFRPTLDAWR